MHDVPEHDVAISGRVRLAVRLHEQHSSAGTHAHPWAELLAPSDASLGVQPGPPGVPDDQRSPASDSGTPPCSDRVSEGQQPAADAATVADDIDTQTLLDGLEELYELDSDDDTKHTSGAASAAALPAAHGGLGGAEESNERIDRGGGGLLPAPSAPSDVEADVVSGHDLADMDDDEAKRIIGSLGGFSRPGSGRGAGARRAEPPPPGTDSEPHGGAAPAHDELAEMSDGEARQFVQSLGGFGRPTCPARAPGSGPASPRPATAPRTPAGKQAASPATPNGASPFPSKSDVLSARRALKMDRGRAQPPPAFNSPTRVAAGLPEPTLPGPPSLGSLGRAACPARAPVSGPRMLAFKHPGLKRPSSQLRFSSPTKRVAAGGGRTSSTGEQDPLGSADLASSMGGNGNVGDAKPAVRLVQFSQPFRSPAKAGQAGPDSRPLPRSRPPPVLPPVTSRPAGGGAAVAMGAAAGRRATARADRAPGVSRPGLKSIAGLRGVGDLSRVPLDARAMTADTAAGHCFAANTVERAWGAESARQALLARGCVPGAVNAAWVENHYRWIVWSSASLARRFPACWHEFWSAERVLDLLHHRYRREYECGERPALRRVLEADAAPQRLMVLCVASTAGAEADARIEVTDGWYGVQARVDAVLARAISQGRLRAGDKIACAGLGVRGIGDGVAALSAGSQGAALLLTANCVRRARWDARLGFQRRTTMAMSLSAVHRQGGAVGATLDVLVVRRYPLRFLETTADGQRVVRSEREEERVALADAERRAQRMQDLLEERLAQRAAGQMDCAGDEEAVIELVEHELPQRQVHALLRMLVCDYPARPYRAPGTSSADALAVVTVWRPGPIEPADLAEGSRLLLTGAAVSSYRGGSPTAAELHLSIRPTAGGLRPAPADPRLVACSRYRRRATLSVDELQHAAAGQEVDVAGEVEHCCAAAAGSQMLVLRLRGAGRDGSVCFADIEFPRCVFGSLSPGVGSVVTVRNCRLLLPARDGDNDDAAVPRLHAGDVAEFAL